MCVCVVYSVPSSTPPFSQFLLVETVATTGAVQLAGDEYSHHQAVDGDDTSHDNGDDALHDELWPHHRHGSNANA